MNNTQKNAVYSLVLIFFMLAVYWWRESQKPDNQAVETNIQPIQIEGKTMGTSYHITYLDAKKRNFKTSVDSLLVVFNNSLSTYQADSEISKFNQDTVFTFQLPFFYPVLAKCQEIHTLSEGAFDPTVASLVNFWGWGFKNFKTQSPEQKTVDSLLQFVGFDKFIQFDKKQIRKTKKGVMLDFNAIAQGYGVDIVADFLQAQGIENQMVEIGGEVVARGKNAKGKAWRIGINNPQDSLSNQLFASLELTNRGLATSGNYRRFYIKDGKKYAHTLNPQTGFPVLHSLLSATVIAPDAMTADAMATVFMVVGLEKAQAILKQKTDLQAYFIYADAQGKLRTFATAEVKKSLKE
jgi:thiamine biosynthesis lipoprotein